MDSKIRELTDKIYQEGVQKGTAEADRIIAEAQKKANEIITNAEKDIQKAKEKSQKESEDLRQKTEMELRLYAKQMVESIKSSISDLITTKVVKETVSNSISDDSLIKEVILELAKNFDLSKGVEVSSSQADSLIKYFKEKSNNLLDKGLSIKEVGGNPTSFSISPSDGSYKLQFGNDEFEELFVSFLRPQMAKMLFDK